MPKQPTRDKPLLTIVAIVLAVLAVGFAGVWLYLKHAEKLDAEVRYLRLAPVAISHNGISMSATVAVRTSGSDEDWAREHGLALEEVVKQALLAADPERVRAPGGLQKLQESLKAASNAMLQTDRVQEVLVTDFLVSEGDL